MSKSSTESFQLSIMKNKIIILLAISLLLVGTTFGQKTKKQKVVGGKICGNPTVKCKTDVDVFQSNDIPFELPKNYIVYQSQPFYAVILKSQVVKDMFGGEENCKAAATEEERLAAQVLFPNNKVFNQICGYGALYYTGIKGNTVFMAVYAGKTLADAQNFLKTVNDTGKFEGAYFKKIQAEFNGT